MACDHGVFTVSPSHDDLDRAIDALLLATAATEAARALLMAQAYLDAPRPDERDGGAPGRPRRRL